MSPAPVSAGFCLDLLKRQRSRGHTLAQGFDAGMTIFEVQHRLGHKRPTVTAEVSTHFMRERFNEGRTRLETYMNDQRH